jgi:hypothetical protein
MATQSPYMTRVLVKNASDNTVKAVARTINANDSFYKWPTEDAAEIRVLLNTYAASPAIRKAINQVVNA